MNEYSNKWVIISPVEIMDLRKWQLKSLPVNILEEFSFPSDSASDADVENT